MIAAHSFLYAGLFAFVFLTGEASNSSVKTGTADAHFGFSPFFGHPHHHHHGFPHHLPFFGTGFFPNHHHQHHHHPFFNFFDTFYCSAHASFALVNFDKHDHQHHDHNKNVYGEGAYGSDDGYQPRYSRQAGFNGPEVGGHFPFHHHGHGHMDVSRQFCRFTATVDGDTCFFCCQVAARHFTTTIDEITGLLLIFDPTDPPIYFHKQFVGSSYRKKRSPQTENPAGSLFEPPPIDPVVIEPTEDPSKKDGRIAQCFCCAPKKNFHFWPF